jgi:SNF2 family DNA or RNA helicase
VGIRELDDFQHDVIAFGNRRGRFVYADAMGARKTATTLAWLQQRESAHKIILVVPGAVVQHWHEEAAEWYPEAMVCHGTTAAARYKLIAQVSTLSAPTIYVTTYDAMKVDANELAGVFDTWIFDEGHRLKGRTTAVALAAYKLTKGATNIACVTGTPVLNHPEELWFYLHMLFRKSFTSFWRWAEEHFCISVLPRNHLVKIVGDYQPGHAAIVRKQISTVFIQREDTELYPDAAWTAEPLFIPALVELSTEEKRHYDKLVNHSWTQFNGKVIKGGNALAINTRLRQLASDWGTLNSDNPNGTKVTYAVELILRLLKQETGGIVVFTEYKETAKRIEYALLKLQVGVGLYTGDEKPAQRELTKQWFIDKQIQVLIGTYGSMKEGVDGLQKVSHQMVLVDLLWVYGLVMQAVGRLRRDGQTYPVIVHPIVARNTVDASVLQANLTKKNVAAVIKGRLVSEVIYGITDIEVLDD